MNIFTKTPQQLEAEAAYEAAKLAAANASEEGDDSPPPVQESATDADGNALKTEILDRTGEVDMGAAEVVEPPALTFEVPETWKIHDPRFGNEKPVKISTGCYSSGSLAIAGLVETEYGEEPFATYTVNLGGGVPAQHVYVKNWSEGEGAEEILLEAGIIEGEPVMYTQSGFVAIPLYKVTDKFWAFARSKGSVL